MGAASTVREMERAGTLIPSLKAQQKLEADLISDARVSGRNQDLPDSEILALYEIPLLPKAVEVTETANDMAIAIDTLDDSQKTISLHYPVNANRTFSPDALARLENFKDPIYRLSFFPAKDGREVFDPELNDLLNDRLAKATLEEKQAAINDAWKDIHD